MKDYSDLDEIDDSLSINRTTSDEVSYPCVFIEGILLIDEVLYFRERLVETDVSLPLYYEFSGIIKCIGRFELSLDNLLRIRNISNYVIYLAQSSESKVAIDINDPNVLAYFIKI